MSRDFDDLNPYAAPSAPILAPEKEQSATSEIRMFLEWEKLRIYYNIILAAVTVLALPIARPKLSFLPWLCAYCLAANLCFCLGPVLNGYAYWMGLRRRGTTLVLFWLGTALATLLALGTVLSMGMPDF